MSGNSNSPKQEELSRAVASQAARKLRAQKLGDRSLWFGFGTFGLIGWSIAVPTLIGAAAGMWIDGHHPSSHSWTLALLVAGLVLGCAQAWHWVVQEDRKINQAERKDDKR
jgi:ATP synthase protein I